MKRSRPNENTAQALPHKTCEARQDGQGSRSLRERLFFLTLVEREGTSLHGGMPARGGYGFIAPAWLNVTIGA